MLFWTFKKEPGHQTSARRVDLFFIGATENIS